MQQRLASNLTDDQWLTAYYRYYKYDLNKTIPNATKSRRKPSLDIRLKSKRRKFEQQQQHEKKILQTNTMFPEKPIDIPTVTSSISTTSTGSAFEAIGGTTTSFSTVETTTAGITKSIDELQPNNSDVVHTTAKIDTNTKIDNRINVNDSTTMGISGTLTTTTTTIAATTTVPPATEHSITYNVTVNDLKRAQSMAKPKSRRISNAGWGRWQKWTKCSRSCGGGVMSQSRLCLSR